MAGLTRAIKGMSTDFFLSGFWWLLAFLEDV